MSHYDDGVTSYYSDSRYGDDADSQYLGDDYYDDDDNWDDDNWDDDDAGEDWYQPPDVEVAEAHAEEMNPQHKQIPKAFSTAPTDLKSYGIGVVLYFTFMRSCRVRSSRSASSPSPPSSKRRRRLLRSHGGSPGERHRDDVAGQLRCGLRWNRAGRL